MATDKAAEQARATTSKCCSAIDATQVEATNPTGTQRGHRSTVRVGKHKPDRADGDTMSNVVDSSVGQVATPQLNGKFGKIPIAIEGAPGGEQSDVCHNLFNTVELLENILSKLPIKDLLFAQSVCKTWKNCIEHSKILQQGLFFAPTDLEPIEVHYDRKEFGGYVTLLEDP